MDDQLDLKSNMKGESIFYLVSKDGWASMAFNDDKHAIAWWFNKASAPTV